MTSSERKLLKMLGFSRGAIKILEEEAKKENKPVMNVAADINALLRIFKDVASGIAEETGRDVQAVLDDMFQKLVKSHKEGTLEKELKAAMARIKERREN